MRYRVIIELDSGMDRNPFNTEVLRKIAGCEWSVCYLATEEVENTNIKEMVNTRQYGR